MLVAADDLRHELASSPHTRESMFHTLALPEVRLVVCTYTWVGADSLAGYLFVVAGPDGEPLVRGLSDGVAVGSADFDDWRVEALSLRHTAALQSAELGVELDDVSFHVTYQGLHPAFSYEANRDGCPPYSADTRFEQSCEVRGTLTLHGQEIRIATTGQRDHSWGNRDWATFQDWKWISAQAGSDVAVNLMVSHARGETTHHGYVFRDGAVSPIVDSRIAAHYDADFRQTGAEAELVDETGRVTRLTMERFAHFGFEVEGRVLNEAGCVGTIDGAQAVVHFECGWDSDYAATQADRARR